jgi:uncharacterized membrane protein
MEHFTIYFVIFFATLIFSRIVGERALKQLNAEEKSRLLDSFSSYRLYNTYVSVGLVIAYFVLADYVWQGSATLILVFLVLFVAASATASVLSYRKLKSLNMPESYNKSFFLRLGIQYVGLAAIFLPLAWQAVKAQR